MAAPTLVLSRYRVRFKPSGDASFLHYAGSAWRGALGHALKRTVCITHLKECGPCLLYRSCPYPYVFETPPPPGAEKMRRYTAVPHPFVLEPDLKSEDGIYGLGVTLIGRGDAYLPYIIHALSRAGEDGVGPGLRPMILLDVEQARPLDSENWVRVYEAGGPLDRRPAEAARIPQAPSTVCVQIETPLRLTGDERLVTAANLRFSYLFGALVRRISMLSYFHTETPLEDNFAQLMESARGFELSVAGVSWTDWTRYSSRQQRLVQMGGLVGELQFDLSAHPEFWPYLWLGQWVHAGKGTSMGLGRYSIRMASLPNFSTTET